jgi:hypothetical protein
MAERAESIELVPISTAGTSAVLRMPAAAVVVLRQTTSASFATEEFFKTIAFCALFGCPRATSG